MVGNELLLALAFGWPLSPGEHASVSLSGIVVTPATPPGGLPVHADQRATD